MDRKLSNIGGYQILECLGRGTTGIVYKAHHVGIGKTVALKTPFLHPPGERSERLARFRREAMLTVSLNHPAIPFAYDLGEADGITYYTREYIDGKTLEHIGINGQIALSTGIRILRDVATTLVTVHAHGIVHRNLHPANILVDTAGNFRLIGFGKAGSVDAPPPWNVSPELDVQGLKSLLSWLCENVRNPIMDSHQTVQDPAFATSASEFADALSTWLQETKGQ